MSNPRLTYLPRLTTLLPWLAFPFLTLLFALPLLPILDSAIIGADPDAFINPWADWWTLQALTRPEITLYETEYLFHPQGADLIFHSFSHLNTAVSLLLRPLLGPLAAYNITMLANLALSGVAMFHLAHYVTRSTAAALLAGVVFAFNSHNLYQSAHPVLFSVWVFPWFTLFSWRAVREEDGRLAALAGLFVALAAAASTLLLILIILWGLFFIPSLLLGKTTVRRPGSKRGESGRRSPSSVILSDLEETSIRTEGPLAKDRLQPDGPAPSRAHGRERQRPRQVAQDDNRTSFLISRQSTFRQWRLLLPFTAVAGGLTLPFLFPLLRAFLLAGNTTFIQESVNAIPLDIAAPFFPHWNFWLWHAIYLGIVPLFLAVVALRGSRPARFWGVVVLVTFLIAIGPRPTVALIPLDVTLPWSIPFTTLLRHPHRLLIILSLGWAVLAAFGWQKLAADLLPNPTVRRAAAVIVIALTFYEFALAPDFPHREPNVSPFFSETLAAEPDNVVIAQFPYGRQEDKLYLYIQTVHQHPIVGGVISRHAADTFAFLDSNGLLRAGAGITSGRPPAPLPAQLGRDLAELAAHNVRFIVLHKPLLGFEQGLKWSAGLPLRPFFEDETIRVYRTSPVRGEDYDHLHTLTPDIALIHASVTQATAGGRFAVSLGWEAAATAPYDYTITMHDTTGNPLHQARRPLPTPAFDGPSPTLLITQIPAPPHLPRGEVTLTVTLNERGRAAPLASTPAMGPFTLFVNQR